MNRRNRQQPQYNSWVDAVFDIKQEDETVTNLVVANNQLVPAVTELQQFRKRYELLTAQEKQRVDSHLRNVYEILGLGPGEQLEEGQNYFQWLQYLLTNVNDHTVRIGRVEENIENIYHMLAGAESYTHSPTPRNVPPQKIVNVEHENPNPTIITHPNPNPITHPNPNPNSLRKRVAITQEQRIIIQSNYKKVPNASIAEACGKSIKWLEVAISQLKQHGQL